MTWRLNGERMHGLTDAAFLYNNSFTHTHTHTLKLASTGLYASQYFRRIYRVYTGINLEDHFHTF